MARHQRRAVGLAATVLFWAWAGLALAEEPPAAPARYFNDYAGVVAADVGARLDAKLGRFDAETSTQIVVAVFPKLPSPSLEDFTVRTAQKWGVGQKGHKNGVVLFAFIAEQKLRVEVGYGLEGALPDALAQRILDDEIRPPFRTRDYAGGLERGVDALMAATRGEYRARTTTAGGTKSVPWLRLLFLVALVVLLARQRMLGYAAAGWWMGRAGSSRSRGGWGGWGGGGGFSGGGGSFGGGGASGGW